ncbi:MAG TPA: fibronectin type III domain-containing protein, partial [Vicinamibacterales bacterium]|nr:fibronectin type III domain-containing protein [Vicinamibacterales bacterium]
TNTGGDSGYSNTATATTLPNPPAAPSGLSATTQSAGQINLAWVDNATNEVNYVVERSTDNVTFTVVVSNLSTNSIAYSNTGLAAGTLYYFRVKATNTGGASAYSNTASATTAANNSVPPGAPANVVLTAVAGPGMTLNWTDTSTNESGFTIQRSTDGVAYSAVTNVGANVITYTNTPVTASTNYYYRIRSFNNAGTSVWVVVGPVKSKAK